MLRGCGTRTLGKLPRRVLALATKSAAYLDHVRALRSARTARSSTCGLSCKIAHARDSSFASRPTATLQAL